MRPTRTIPPIVFRVIALLLAALLLAGCASTSKLQSTLGHKFKYSYSMTDPAQSADMLYRDDQLIIQFRVDDPGLRFQVQNITSDPMSIDWAKATITVRGVSSAVRTGRTLYDTTKTPPAAQTIPSLGVLRESVVPLGNSYFDGSQWRIDDLLPTTDANTHTMRSTISSLPGSMIEFRLPVTFGSEPRWYMFAFRADSVKQVSWNDYRPASWIPPHPPVKTLRPSPESQFTAVIIASSFLGFLRYIMTMNKVPVVE